MIILGDVDIGCPNSPKRKSYFCEDHQHIDPLVKFKYGNTTFECSLSQIKPSRRKLSKENLNIYDNFLSKNDQVMYLVDYSDKSPFWATKKQIPNSILTSFLRDVHTYNNSCKTLKTFALPCEKYQELEIFGSETLVQSTCFLIDVYENIEQKPIYIGYDDGCHLKKFIDSSEKIKLETARLVELRNKIIIIDRFHYKGHKKANEYCKTKCNPNNYVEIKDANTSIVEQSSPLLDFDFDFDLLTYVQFWLNNKSSTLNGETSFDAHLMAEPQRINSWAVDPTPAPVINVYPRVVVQLDSENIFRSLNLGRGRTLQRSAIELRKHDAAPEEERKRKGRSEEEESKRKGRGKELVRKKRGRGKEEERKRKR
ncbi:hypothetical protein BpHYR1_044154 [Brachionus plicatilis]|uniref:Uncharacterized protein n=1 Tax=Brachionus plicatilis TaxID=10195 RepID=A0A3M7T124_BRAPC|nr:hypothetical protein BpHYR1_044154 [Brachionus plicatilis]